MTYPCQDIRRNMVAGWLDADANGNGYYRGRQEQAAFARERSNT
jgi:hypothetical protein